MVRPEPAEPRSIPRGLIAFPFALAAGMTLLVPLALAQSVSGRWIAAAVLVGITASGGTLGWNLRRAPLVAAAPAPEPPREPEPSPEPAGETAPEPPPEKGHDPLANIHAVEAQGRRHRRPCPNCGTPVRADRETCPNCAHMLLVDCKGCRTRVRLDWGVCPECGRPLP